MSDDLKAAIVRLRTAPSHSSPLLTWVEAHPDDLHLVLDELKKLQGWADADKRLEAKVREDERRKVGEELVATFGNLFDQMPSYSSMYHVEIIPIIRRICGLEEAGRG